MFKGKKRGFTLIEAISSLFIISIVVIGSLNFYKISGNLLSSSENQGIINTNLRIAQEFIVDKVKNSSTIRLNGSSILIDGDRLFVERSILRYGSASQQISPDIMKVSVEDIGSNLYRINTIGEYETLSTIVKRGE
ncbi:PilW family protein [Clostridium cylindrosporum]|uniref:Prepilin-type N-terminal cleavage/methylation domain-containing protein n=1 Tax=Clostridium cylindrosporum DSM 605 TaxID=1121307 RepID=A0A0J8D651_CLOCY|nr:prepilin-type N-terminal cleavage/methylation domain-containing protein [Clostridium cylindrosporum]KMT21332.1 hypothetical protein CLCY_2c00920 [Clostridium cylindrosporum DSM 605]